MIEWRLVDDGIHRWIDCRTRTALVDCGGLIREYSNWSSWTLLRPVRPEEDAMTVLNGLVNGGCAANAINPDL